MHSSKTAPQHQEWGGQQDCQNPGNVNFRSEDVDNLAGGQCGFFACQLSVTITHRGKRPQKSVAKSSVRAAEGVTPARKRELEELRDVCYSLSFFSLVVQKWIYVTLLLLCVLINCHR